MREVWGIEREVCIGALRRLHIYIFFRVEHIEREVCIGALRRLFIYFFSCGA